MSKKKILFAVLFILVAIGFWQHKLLYYGYVQARGQIHVVTNTTPVQAMLNAPETPDSIKFKLRLIDEVKRFAVDSLGMNPTDNYTEVFDQEGKPIMWVVTAAAPFSLEAKEWSFPIVGSFSYKGFFRYEMAVDEELIWKNQGFDTNIRTTGGWSTLGWFKDPILSNMLHRKVGDLSELIIHELTHGTLFVKDSIEFNENLATFIGTRGAEKFLSHRFGKESEEMQEYIHGNDDHDTFTQHILLGATKLDSLYHSFDESVTEAEKIEKKQALINSVFTNVDTLSLHRKDAYLKHYQNYEANNTYFMSFIRYNRKLDGFEELFEREFNSDLRVYLDYLKSEYPSL